MIKVNYDIKKYRESLLSVVSENSTVIELGCHVGGTTKLFPKTCNIIAVDNSPEATVKMNKLNHVKFIKGDVRMENIISQVFNLTQKCDILAIDLGGGYHPDTVFKVFYIWSSTFKPIHTVIRNRGILEFLNSSTYDEKDYISNDGFLDSYHDSGIPPQIKEFEIWMASPKK